MENYKFSKSDRRFIIFGLSKDYSTPKFEDQELRDAILKEIKKDYAKDDNKIVSSTNRRNKKLNS